MSHGSPGLTTLSVLQIGTFFVEHVQQLTFPPDRLRLEK